MKVLTLSALFLASIQLGFAQTPTAKSPPLGIEIPEQSRAALAADLAQFQADFDAVVKAGQLEPWLAALLPDIEIFPIAVRRALEWNEFYDLKQPDAAAALL